jgi:DNA-binding transcriptional regulator YhcF (GntR family)
MSKRAIPLNKPEIMLDQNASPPLYRQLYERLRGSILSGQLEAGTRLPSTRVLASSLGVSRTTTALAYEQLLLEGYIESRWETARGWHVCNQSNCIRAAGTRKIWTPPVPRERLQPCLRGAAKGSSTCRIQKNSTGNRQVAERACSSLASQM